MAGQRLAFVPLLRRDGLVPAAQMSGEGLLRQPKVHPSPADALTQGLGRVGTSWESEPGNRRGSRLPPLTAPAARPRNHDGEDQADRRARSGSRIVMTSSILWWKTGISR